MCKKLIYLISVMVLALFLTSSAYAASIVWVTEISDDDADGIQDDQGFIDVLMAEGHYVNVQPDNWKEIADPNTPEKLAELNAADLVIISRTISSGNYDEEGEPNMWNSVTSPMILMSGYLHRTNRWSWMNNSEFVNADDILMATDASHPVFEGVELIDGMMVLAYDNTVSGGCVTFAGTTDVGNGTLIAQGVGGDYTAIAEWEAGVEMFPGGAIAGGPRMLFIAGSWEKDCADVATVGPQGGYNLLDDGKKMYLNAVNYMLNKSASLNIVWVTEISDDDADGIQDDQGFIDVLMAEGHYVNVQPDNWKEIADPNTPEKLAELNAADLVIISRTISSGNYDEEGEPNMWNSVTSPMIQMSGYLPRTNRWLWMNTGSIVNADDILLVTDASHPVFDGVELIDGTMVMAYDNTVSGGLVTFPAATDVGSGTLIAQGLGGDYAAIAEWEAGVEMYPGGAIAGGPRMLFVAGSWEKDATDIVVGPQGGYNLLDDGKKMFLNAISYMASAGQ